MKLAIAFAAAAATMLLLDGVWLTMMASTYRRLFGEQLLEHFRIAPAVAFYVLYLAGVIVMVVAPALDSDAGYPTVAARGAMLGLMAYGTYALTNYATLKVYGGQLAAMDLVWGPVLTAATAVVATAAARHFAP